MSYQCWDAFQQKSSWETNNSEPLQVAMSPERCDSNLKKVDTMSYCLPFMLLQMPIKFRWFLMTQIPAYQDIWPYLQVRSVQFPRNLRSYNTWYSWKWYLVCIKPDVFFTSQCAYFSWAFHKNLAWKSSGGTCLLCFVSNRQTARSWNGSGFINFPDCVAPGFLWKRKDVGSMVTICATRRGGRIQLLSTTVHCFSACRVTEESNQCPVEGVW